MNFEGERKEVKVSEGMKGITKGKRSIHRRVWRSKSNQRKPKEVRRITVQYRTYVRTMTSSHRGAGEPYNVTSCCSFLLIVIVAYT